MKIRILDDEERQREAFIGAMLSVGLSEDDYDIDLLTTRDLSTSFIRMWERQNVFRKKGYWEADPPIPLDDVDVLIIDNELREFFDDIGIFTDADQVAYMARAFSTCGVIIVMNRISQNPFDLTLTLAYERQFESFSDLEIGSKQLSSKALWGTGDEKFHPWYWPVVPTWVADFKQRVRDVRNALLENAPILEYFGLDDYRDWMSRDVLQYLGAETNPTFQGFLKDNPFALSRKDGRVLRDGNDFTETMVESISRLVAARLSKWLEWKVLPQLDVLVDAPHLVTRLPSLLSGDHSVIDTWNATVVRHTSDVPNLNIDLLKRYEFTKPCWLSRPVWYWRKVMKDESIPDVKAPWSIEYVPIVFCEDTSTFAADDNVYSFRPKVESPFTDRYIKKISGVDYLPVQRLAM